MREFILRARKAVTKPFNLNDLVDSAGRMDLVCRCISNAFFISESIRKDTVFHVILEGPNNPPKIISFFGKELRNVSPDEKNIASCIRIALEKGHNLKLNEEIKVFPGINIAKKSFEQLIKERVKSAQLIYLHSKGKDIREFDFADNACFIVGDVSGIPEKSEKLLDRLGAKRVSVGQIEYLASQTIVICHNELDRRGF